MSGVMCLYISVDQYLPSRKKSISISVPMRFDSMSLYVENELKVLGAAGSCAHAHSGVCARTRKRMLFLSLSLDTQCIGQKRIRQGRRVSRQEAP